MQRDKHHQTSFSKKLNHYSDQDKSHVSFLHSLLSIHHLLYLHEGLSCSKLDDAKIRVKND